MHKMFQNTKAVNLMLSQQQVSANEFKLKTNFILKNILMLGLHRV